MTTDVPVNDTSGQAWTGELLLDPEIHGKSRVPGPRTTGFDLFDFARALEDRDVDYQASRYAPDAEIRIVTPDNPPSAPQVVLGRPAIHAWLLHARTRDLALRVTDLVDGGDRIAFTERWHHQDETTVVATSTAEIDDALITMRHTILVWDRDKSEG
jgi:hypothetical protein